MNLADEIQNVIRYELDQPGELDKERLYKNLLIVFDRYRAHTDNLASQLHRLIGDETALTIPLADGSVAKVKFSQPVTRPHMIAFAKIFSTIAEHYVVPVEKQIENLDETP